MFSSRLRAALFHVAAQTVPQQAPAPLGGGRHLGYHRPV